MAPVKLRLPDCEAVLAIARDIPRVHRGPPLACPRLCELPARALAHIQELLRMEVHPWCDRPRHEEPQRDLAGHALGRPQPAQQRLVSRVALDLRLPPFPQLLA